jgi:methylmalonyl-CoA mutase cobalamin-binding domain/chain
VKTCEVVAGIFSYRVAMPLMCFIPAFADMGFDADVGSLSKPQLRRPILSSRALRTRPIYHPLQKLVPELITELRNRGRDDILVFVGGVIPSQDSSWRRGQYILARYELDGRSR